MTEVKDMTQSEARAALIAAVNQIRSDKNVRRLAEYKEKYNAYHERGNYRIPAPKRPIFVTIFNARQIDQAVFMARQRGGFEDLLKKAGFRVKK